MTGRGDFPEGTRKGRVIGIIGGGFSGTMVAVQLRRRLRPEDRVLLFERGGESGRGLAYQRGRVPNLLNVRSANMSAYPDDPGHFDQWLAHRGPSAADEVHGSDVGAFATRRLYGDYLGDQPAAPAGGAMVEHHAEEIIDVQRAGTGFRLETAGGAGFHADGVVVAVGNLARSGSPDGVVFPDPWNEAALTDLPQDAKVAVIGTGLTMVDLVLGLFQPGFGGQVTALSRRGLLPRPHAPAGGTWPTPSLTSREQSSAVALLQRVRSEIALAAKSGIDWRAVIDCLRPVTRALWQGMPLAEQRRFLRHLRPYWDVHRHRIPPMAASRIEALLREGSLTVRAGRIERIEPASGSARISWRPRGQKGAQALDVQRVIYATGPESAKGQGGLLDNLCRNGLARLDPLGLGLDVTENLRLPSADGSPQDGLWALGPIVRGVFWECTAVPDIRVQAQALAEEITAWSAVLP